jgi:hypothetical protein
MSKKTKTNNRALHRSRREPRGAAGDTSPPNFDLRDCGCAQPNAPLRVCRSTPKFRRKNSRLHTQLDVSRGIWEWERAKTAAAT